jgi:hypothetical protein
MGAVIVFVTRWSEQIGAGTLWHLVLAGGAGMLVYLGVALLLHVGELNRLPAALLERR